MIHWRIGGRSDGGADEYETVIRDGACEAHRGLAPEEPRVAFAIDGADFLKLVTGNVAGPDAVHERQAENRGRSDVRRLGRLSVHDPEGLSRWLRAALGSAAVQSATRLGYSSSSGASSRGSDRTASEKREPTRLSSASTTIGSNWVPALARSSVTAASTVSASR